MNDVEFVDNKITNIINLLKEVKEEISKTKLSKHFDDYDGDYIRNTVDILLSRVKIYYRYIFKIPSEDVFCLR